MSGKGVDFGDKKIKKVISTKTKDYLRQMTDANKILVSKQKNHMAQKKVI